MLLFSMPALLFRPPYHLAATLSPILLFKFSGKCANHLVSFFCCYACGLAFLFHFHDQQQNYILNLKEQIIQIFLSSVKEQLCGTVSLMILRTLILSIVLRKA